MPDTAPAPATIAEAIAKRDSRMNPYVPHARHQELERDWRSEVIYFLLPDRFNAVERDDPPQPLPVTLQRWDLWAISGRNRFQGGTIAGVIDKLDYLSPGDPTEAGHLGVTTLWVGPVWKQRNGGVDTNVGSRNAPVDDLFPAQPPWDIDTARHILCPQDDYHGYAIQDFLRVDPRFGSTQDLRALVDAAHDRGMRVIFDIVINHSGENWLYNSRPLDTLRPPYLADPSSPGFQPAIGTRYAFGQWLDENGSALDGVPTMERRDAAVWPVELQCPEVYHRRGFGSYSSPVDNHDNDPEFRDADWMNRDFRYDPPDAMNPACVAAGHPPLLDTMVAIWTYWMAVTDCDGFRVDTFKHVQPWVGAEFCRRIRAFAHGMNKQDFLVAGEIGGGDAEAAWYLAQPDDVGLRVLEVGERRLGLRQLAGADPVAPPASFVLTPEIDGVAPEFVRDRVVTTIDDHDGLGTGAPCRLARRYTPASVVPALALLLFGPGIPCLYYGTEQALTGPSSEDGLAHLSATDYGLDDYSHAGDRYLREAMFAPRHPRKAGAAGMGDGPDSRDPDLPGFAPGTYGGSDVFDPSTPTFRAAQSLIAQRGRHDALWSGDIEVCRVTGPDGQPLEGVVAWTRTSAAGACVLVLINTDTPGSAPVTATVQLQSLAVGDEVETRVAVPDGVAKPAATIALVADALTQQPALTVKTDPGSVLVFERSAG